MTAQFVLVKADVSIIWEGAAPDYRLYVGGELFADRTYIWQEQYLEELIQIYAPPGDYELHWELVPSTAGEITVTNVRIDNGPVTACIVNNSVLRIEHEST